MRILSQDLSLRRFLTIGDYEQDEGFRSLLRSIARKGLFIYGLLGSLILVIFVTSHVFLDGKSITWDYSSLNTEVEILILDKVLIFLFASLLMLLSQTTISLKWIRILVFLLVWFICIAMLIEDIAGQDTSFTMAYTAIALLFAAVTVPYTGWQMALLSFSVIVSTWFAFDLLPVLMNLDSEVALQLNLGQIIFITIVAFLLTGTSSQIYITRFEQYRAQKKAEDLSATLKERSAELENSLRELEDTKDQLVQREKLASLGQLTAGIAHELKNPLNFVNNFSELSRELVQEAREEISSANDIPEDAFVILENIEANLQKIQSHGARADRIIHSMLEHSRRGSGNVESWDLNKLVIEYVNLAYHGMKAKDEPLNPDIELDLDDKIEKIPIIAEDFSRVILNICNNAFDAMKEKVKATESGAQSAYEYEPKLKVQTRRIDSGITIEFEDNGPGIPEDVLDKIMQPFFTTKKGKDGTGLGLSISSDIVKAHGGHISVQSEPGSGAIFMITLKGAEA